MYKEPESGMGARALRLGQTWSAAALEIAHLGSCHLGIYPWEVTTWINALGKVPIIQVYYNENLIFPLVFRNPNL